MKRNSVPFIKGVMFDLGRVIEKHSYYRKMLPFLAEWGYNTVFLHLTDDHGCALEFKSMPEIVSPHAFSQVEMRRFVKDAALHGLEVIPEIESLGHTEYITRLPRYRHLYERLPGPRTYGAICPTRPDAVEIFGRLYAEVADIFPSPLIHAGLDEVTFGTCSTCRRAMRSREEWELFGNHIGALHERIKSLGKQMAMWGDHLLSEERLADMTPKDVVVCHWYYRPDIKKSQVALLLKKGFKVICCPALVGMNQTILPGKRNLENVRNFSEAAWEFAPKGVIGLLNTVWEPFRYPQGSINYGLALAGRIFADRGRKPPRFAEKYVESYHGIKPPDEVAGAIRSLHEIDLPWPLVRKATFRVCRERGTITREEVAAAGAVAETATRALSILRRYKTEVRFHRKEYREMILAADITKTIGDRLCVLSEILAPFRRMRRMRRNGRTGEAAKTARNIKPRLRKIVREGKRIHRLAVANWNATRYADDYKRDKVLLKPWGFDDGITARLGVSAGLLERMLKEVEETVLIK